MAGDLRALFSTNDRQLKAVEAFTNRERQWQAVMLAVAEHLRLLEAGHLDTEDLEAPRGNVLVLHGVGGIGKTTLSRRLEAALGGQRCEHWAPPPWPAGRVLPVRIDLSAAAGADFERVILSLRLALTELGRPLPAFDIALRRYWETQHPGESLEEYLQRDGLASKFGQALPEHLKSALSDVAQALLLPGTVGSAVGEVTGSLVGALRERRQTVRALAGCARLADLLEAEPDIDALSFYPHLLAWELQRVPAQVGRMPVVLLDAFEEAAGDRTRRDMERLLQRLVWLMPNTFFVVTGRSRLQWGEAALHGQLDWAGPTAWPGLAAHSLPHLPRRGPGHDYGRQILIGDFSAEDCEDYLARRLTEHGAPVIPDDVRHTIAQRSHGLPLFLDLSVMRYLSLRRTGHTPQPADFEADFPALISRTLTDLTADERHVLRSTALLEAFDLPLATAAAGLPHQSAAARLVERPFVGDNAGGLWPYRLHALIRSTLREAEDTTDDRWTPSDWHQAAERAHAALGEQWRTSPGARGDRRWLTGCLRQGLVLARDFALDLGWLTDAAWAYVADSIWEPIAPPPPARDSDAPGEEVRLGSAADALVELLSALARRQHEHRSHTADRLAAVLNSRQLPEELEEMALYYRAKADRDLGRSEASRRGMQQVVDHGGRLAPAARRGLAHLARLAGDFPTALETARALGWAGRGHRVEGDIWWPHGQMDRAASSYEAAREEAAQHGVTGEQATAQAHRALALAFTDPARADDEIALAEQLLTGLDLRATRLTVQIAHLVRDAGTPNVPDRATRLEADITTAGVTALHALLHLALAFHHAVLDDQAQLDAHIARLENLTAGGEYAYYTDLAHYMADRPSPAKAEGSTLPRWSDSPDNTRQRWQALVRARRAL